MSDEPKRYPSPTPMMQIIHLSKLFRDQMRRASEESGIPGGYRLILIELSHREKMTQYELAKRAHLTPPTVSVTLQKMEHDGYITRTPDECDLRQMQVSLTEKGTAAELANRERATSFEQVILNGFTDEEKRTLAALLTRMENNLHSAINCAPPNTPERKLPNEKMV